MLADADDGTFAALEQKINSGYGSTITLQNNYKCEGNEYRNGITIAQSITIDGNGYTIDANGIGMIFDVPADNVTIKNLTFVNATITMGGAIGWTGSNGNVSDCTFVNNHANNYGGAILWEGSNGSVHNCIFEKNRQNNGMNQKGGGAIYWIGDDGRIFNCSFIDNRAVYYGGAVRWLGLRGNISNCSFEDSYTYDGGAIYWDNGATGNISYCTFTGNTATDYGGAIYLKNARIPRLL